MKIILQDNDVSVTLNMNGLSVQETAKGLMASRMCALDKWEEAALSVRHALKDLFVDTYKDGPNDEQQSLARMVSIELSVLACSEERKHSEYDIDMTSRKVTRVK